MPGKNDNLKPIRSKEEAREKGSKGGKASGKARREKKLMSQIYAEFLDRDHEILGKNGLKRKVSGPELLSGVMSKVLSRGDSAAVSLLKEIREATEGSKVEHTGNIPVQIIIEGVKTEDTGP